jgi:hypothetical protein
VGSDESGSTYNVDPSPSDVHAVLLPSS